MVRDTHTHTHTHTHYTLPSSSRTPLHCAVAYSNCHVISYLLSKGASLFLKTQEGDSPLSLGQVELRAQQEMAEGGNVAAAEQALHCLQGQQSHDPTTSTYS